MQLERQVIVTIGGYDIDLTDTLNMILALLTKILKAYLPGDEEETAD